MWWFYPDRGWAGSRLAAHGTGLQRGGGAADHLAQGVDFFFPPTAWMSMSRSAAAAASRAASTSWWRFCQWSETQTTVPHYNTPRNPRGAETSLSAWTSHVLTDRALPDFFGEMLLPHKQVSVGREGGAVGGRGGLQQRSLGPSPLWLQGHFSLGSHVTLWYWGSTKFVYCHSFFTLVALVSTCGYFKVKLERLEGFKTILLLAEIPFFRSAALPFLHSISLFAGTLNRKGAGSFLGKCTRARGNQFML